MHLFLIVVRLHLIVVTFTNSQALVWWAKRQEVGRAVFGIKKNPKKQMEELLIIK